MAKIVPCLWYTDKAEEAAAFYVSLMPDSRIDSVTTLPADTPSGRKDRCRWSRSRLPDSRSWR